MIESDTDSNQPSLLVQPCLVYLPVKTKVNETIVARFRLKPVDSSKLTRPSASSKRAIDQPPSSEEQPPAPSQQPDEDEISADEENDHVQVAVSSANLAADNNPEDDNQHDNHEEDGGELIDEDEIENVDVEPDDNKPVVAMPLVLHEPVQS